MIQHISWESGLLNVKKPMWEARLTKRETSIKFTFPFSDKHLFALLVIILIVQDHISHF